VKCLILVCTIIEGLHVMSSDLIVPGLHLFTPTVGQNKTAGSVTMDCLTESKALENISKMVRSCYTINHTKRYRKSWVFCFTKLKKVKRRAFHRDNWNPGLETCICSEHFVPFVFYFYSRNFIAQDHDMISYTSSTYSP